MAEKTNAPEIRFKGFTDPWEQRKLGELYSLVSEKNDLTFGRESIISVANMYFNANVNVTDEQYLRTYNVMRLGDIAFEGHSNKEFSHGRFVENYIGDGIVSHIFTVLRPRVPFDVNYWRYAINNEKLMRLPLIRSTKASTMMHDLVPSDFLREAIPTPTLAEQMRIGAFLVGLDSLITLHQRKYDKLCTVKKSMLDKMFPKPGETEPEIRFEGFTDPWEQRKLGNCGTTYSGLSGKTKEDFGHGNARFVPYTNVFDNPLTDTERLEAVEIDSSQNKVAYGDAFFTVSSETPDEVGMSSVWLSDQDDVYLNSFCFGYRQDSTFDPHYLAYMLRSSSIRSDLTLLAQGISRFNISKNKVMELSVAVPSAVEQRQIGQYFARLDSLITFHQRELNLLKNTKKSLLDKMFV